MILRAAWVVPVAAPPIRDGYVQIDGSRIAAVGSASSLANPSDAINVGHCILTPGLVNAHTHLELTCYAGLIAPAPFWEWIPQLVRLRAAQGQIEREGRAAIDGAWRSLRFGVTCVGDISRRNVHWRGLRSIPIRKVCYVELLSLADSPPRNLDELRAAVAEVEEDSLLTVGVTPHAPYSVPEHEIGASIAFARQIGRPWTTHWMETREECAFLRGEVESPHPFLVELIRQCRIEPPRCGAMEYLARCLEAAGHSPFPLPGETTGGSTRESSGEMSSRACTLPQPLPERDGGERGVGADMKPHIAREPRGLLAHMNYPDAGDAARAAAMGLAIAYCPRAHHFFGHPPHPYREYLDAGVNVVLGTDSVASNWSLSVLAEAQYVSQRTKEPPPADLLLRMITINAARALGLDQAIGTIEPGKQADLVAFPCPPHIADPVAHLITHAPEPTKVWTAGELRIANSE